MREALKKSSWSLRLVLLKVTMNLVADTQLCLEGEQSVCVVILAKYYEYPLYRNQIPFGI